MSLEITNFEKDDSFQQKAQKLDQNFDKTEHHLLILNAKFDQIFEENKYYQDEIDDMVRGLSEE